MPGKTIKDLPLYDEADKSESKPVWLVLESSEKSQLEQAIATLRKETCGLMKSFQHQKDQTVQVVNQTSKTITDQVNTISTEYRLVPKLAFISLSGFSGLLLAYRRSVFRKFIYSSVLAGGAAALCYPNEAKAYSGQVSNVINKNAYQLYRQYVWPDEQEAKEKAKKPSPSVETTTTNSKDKVVKLDSESIKSAKASKEFKGDKGQSNDADQDMYTTRSK